MTDPAPAQRQESVEEKMNCDDIRAAIEEILKKVDDNERAHLLEDRLYENVLRAIVADPTNARNLAAEALRAKSIDFDRWYS